MNVTLRSLQTQCTISHTRTSLSGKLSASLKSARKKRETEEREKGFFKKPSVKDGSDDEEERCVLPLRRHACIAEQASR